MRGENQNKNQNFLFKKPLLKQNHRRKQRGMIQNRKPFPENNDPSTLNITNEKLWSMKNIQIALVVGFVLLIVDLILLFSLNTGLSGSLIIVLISVVLYAIALYFLLNPPYQKTIEKERTKQIEKPTIKVIEKKIEKPVIKIIEKPVERIKYIEKPIIKRVSAPVTIPVNKNPMKAYPYVASVKSKTIHATHTTAGRMIKPENREFAKDIKELTKKGYAKGHLNNNPRKTSAKKAKKKMTKKAARKK